jgi:hypothetical protein
LQIRNDFGLMPIMDDPSLTIEIASRLEAGEILTSPQRCLDLAYLVSIGDPYDELPSGYHTVARKLRLLIGDVVTELGATDEDILQIIRLAESLRGSSGRVLIHCEAGVSRSSAASCTGAGSVPGASGKRCGACWHSVPLPRQTPGWWRLRTNCWDARAAWSRRSADVARRRGHCNRPAPIRR